MRSFQRLPTWILLLGVFLSGLVIPITWMLQRSNVYEASILCGQVFLMGGVYFAWRAFEETEVSACWLAWTAVFWVFAIASRTIVAFVIIVFVILIFSGILRRYGLKWTPRFNALILALGIPMILGAIGMGWYNVVRFGSVFDFGLDYMLTSHNNHEFKGSFFSSRYVAANTYNYLFNSPERIQPFLYFGAKAGNETEAFGSPVPEPYYAEKVTGLVYVLPFAIFAFIPALQILLKKMRHRHGSHETEQLLDWFSLALSGGTLIATVYLLVYYYGTMRYLADVTSMLAVLSVIGFWIGYQIVESDWFVRFVYVGIGILLACISMIVPNMLALLSSQRINMYSPQILPALDALFKSVFSG
jgi:xanthosine utilization system XapX-like protein